MSTRRSTASQSGYGGLYADKIVADGQNVRNRLGSNREDRRGVPGIRQRVSFKSSSGAAQSTGKRPRDPNDEGKWQHDLFEDGGTAPTGGGSALKTDLRARLKQKAEMKSRLRQRTSGLKAVGAGSTDLRHKLLGQALSSVRPEKQRRLTVVVANDRPVVTKRTEDVDDARMEVEIKDDGKHMDTFLTSLGLEKYIGKFHAEEIDLDALKQMSEDDLKELGIPMGPRKKILLSAQA